MDNNLEGWREVLDLIRTLDELLEKYVNDEGVTSNQMKGMYTLAGDLVYRTIKKNNLVGGDLEKIYYAKAKDVEMPF